MYLSREQWGSFSDKKCSMLLYLEYSRRYPLTGGELTWVCAQNSKLPIHIHPFSKLYMHCWQLN